MKTVGEFRWTRYRRVGRTGLAGHLVRTTYNLVRMARLLAPPVNLAPTTPPRWRSERRP